MDNTTIMPCVADTETDPPCGQPLCKRMLTYFEERLARRQPTLKSVPVPV
jgi:hypothetical protein